jgi:hypothetical protein
MMKLRIALCLLLGFSSASHAQLEGMIDVHMHSAPDSMARSIDAFETARNAKAAGMRAIVLKNHYTQTAGTAYLVSQIVPDLEIYGGIALNRAVGGLNTVAIDHMVRTTGSLGRIVWMPTFDSEHYHLTGTPNPAFVAIAASGELLPETLAVLQSISANNLALATGHSSPEESLMLIQAAREAGINRIIVTHPALPQVGMTLEQEQQAAELGAFLEYCIGFALNSDAVFMQFVEQIRQLGPEHVILSTDLGQPGNPSHAEGLRMFVEKAKAAGITQAELDIMLKTNPATLLGL